MHLFHIPQCNIQNRRVYISVLNDALWYVEPVHCAICEIGILAGVTDRVIGSSRYISGNNETAMDYYRLSIYRGHI